ncbi:MAG: hypothetical protein H5U11_12880 [Rhizobium sp.]|nr:hypothetical protein [Rhizobium sp.]
MPILNSDEEAEIFVGTADLSEYDLSGFAPANFEFTHSQKTQSAEKPPIPDQGNGQ